MTTSLIIKFQSSENKVSVYTEHKEIYLNPSMAVKSTHIHMLLIPCSIFIIPYLPYPKLSLLMCTLTDEVKSVGEIPPPINCAACVDVAVPGPTLCRPVLVMEPGCMLG